jgi:colicin import membrane protein
MTPAHALLLLLAGQPEAGPPAEPEGEAVEARSAEAPAGSGASPVGEAAAPSAPERALERAHEELAALRAELEELRRELEGARASAEEEAARADALEARLGEVEEARAAEEEARAAAAAEAARRAAERRATTADALEGMGITLERLARGEAGGVDSALAAQGTALDRSRSLARERGNEQEALRLGAAAEAIAAAREALARGDLHDARVLLGRAARAASDADALAREDDGAAR